ncbi:hypothetical protein BMS3Abin10_00383 [bacterium BMS3Abin10]|nr:hypothetical protein BMS3Abin10_00383 [bacterium BMS3Abin10]GBE39907.1 hypothetical protein BMS3Bbin08_02541 [bacterium BMS3Bbin08]
MKSNYMVKVEDAKLVDIQKALQAAGVKVTSIIEVFKDKGEEAKEARPAEA